MERGSLRNDSDAHAYVEVSGVVHNEIWKSSWSGRGVIAGFGKTTLLGALLAACPPEQRIVTVEETFELAVDAPDIVSLQGRQPSLEGTGEVSLRRLVREALRMRPDRLVVGEVRDAEALDLLLALNTGVPGAATVHANSARDALVRLSALPLLAGRNIDSAFVQPAVATSVHLVVHCEMGADGRRRVAEIIAPTGRIVDGLIAAETVYLGGAGASGASAGSGGSGGSGGADASDVAALPGSGGRAAGAAA